MLPTARQAVKCRRSLQYLQLFQNLAKNQRKVQSMRLNSGCSTLTLENTFKCYELEKGPPMDVELSREDALKMYKQMVEVRRIEAACGALYKMKSIRGFCHLYIGQEAVAVGMCAVLNRNDSVITAYRAHGWTYLMGVSAQGLIGELVGVKSGCCRGKGGSMHTYSDCFYGGNGIVGAQVPVGAGIALAHRYKKDDGLCVTLYGDGAANQGQVFEAFNMAKLWDLPCIFVCENNYYAMGTHVDRHSALTDFYIRGQYLPGLWVDGNQVLAVRSATQFAADYARNCGPILLEMCTYRYEGHSMSDPGTSYRSRDEVKGIRQSRDPIDSFKKQILTLCLADEAELKSIDDAVRKDIDEVVKKVKADREVDLSELWADVYSKNVEPKVRGVSGYNLDHIRLSEVCFGKPKRTPPEEINDVPVGDAAFLAAQNKMKEERAAREAREAAENAKSGKASEAADSKEPSEQGETAPGDKKPAPAPAPSPAAPSPAAPSPAAPPPPAAASAPAGAPGKTEQPAAGGSVPPAPQKRPNDGGKPKS